MRDLYHEASRFGLAGWYVYSPKNSQLREGAMQATLTIEGNPDMDAEELYVLTVHLRLRLLELDIEDAELVRGDEIPVGAKPVEAITIGALVVSLSPTVLKTVIALVNTWLQHRPLRTARVTIDGDSVELVNPSRADQHHLVQAFIDKHAKQ